MPILISTGQITIVDTNDGLSAQLSSNSFLLPADKDGNVNSYTGAETTFTITEAGVDMSTKWGFFVVATGGGVTYRDINDTVNRSDVGPANGVLDSNYLKITSLSQASSWIDITATRAGQQDITRRYSVAKAVVGATGTRGTLTVTRAISGGSWVDTEAAAAISGVGGGTPIRGDIATLFRTSPAYSETRVYNGTAWVSQAAYLAGSQIIDNSIPGTKIVAASVTATQIASNTITANNLAANTITTSRLAVTDFTNFVANGDLTLGQASWSGVTVASDSANAYIGNNVIVLPSSATVQKYASNDNVFSVKAGDTYYLEWWGKATSDADGSANIYLRINNAAGGQISTQNVGSINSANTSYVLKSGVITIPANAYQAYIQINWSHTVGTSYIGSVRMRRRNEGSLIVDGTITGNKIAANSVAANQLTVTSRPLSTIGLNFRIDADGALRWDAGTVQYQDTSGTLNQRAIVSGSSAWASATKYVSLYVADGASNTNLDALNNNSLVNNSNYRLLAIWEGGSALNTMGGVGTIVNGDRIVTGTIKANAIAANTITGNKLAGETITGDKLVAGTISAAQIGAGAIVATKLAIGSTDNIIPDADMRDPASWGIADYANAELFDTNTSWTFFRRAIRFKPAGALGSKFGPFFAVEPGATYKIKVSTYIGPSWNYADGWFNPSLHMPGLQWMSLRTFTKTDNDAPHVKQAQSWTTTTGAGVVNTQDYVFTNPVNANLRQWQFRFDGNMLGDIVEFAVSITRVSDATLIQDGAITTNKITVNTLNGDRIQTGTLNADRIAANSVMSNFVTVSGTSGNLGDAILRAEDPAKRINEYTTQITPGKIVVQGSTSLNDWRDGTEIRGGAIKSNSITAAKLTINSRGINTENIDFEVRLDRGSQELCWNGGGWLQYVDDNGTAQSRQIAAGSTYGITKRCFVYWLSGESSFRVGTSPSDILGNLNAVMIATYMGGTNFSVTYGGTIIDGSRITTGSITADTLAVGAISARSISLGATTEGLLANGGAETGTTDGWTGQGFVIPGGNGSAYNHGQSPNSGNGYYSKAFPVTAGKTYGIAWDLYGSNAYFRVMWSNSKPTFNVSSNSYVDLMANAGLGNTWQNYDRTWTAPAGAAWVSIVLYNTGGSNNIYWDNIQFFDQVSGVRIQDGAITANKISVNALSAVSANIGDVTAGTIRNANGSTRFDVTAGRITFNNGAVMRVMGNGFGSSNQFIEWFGPSQSNLANCTEANATQYLRVDGSAYYGGTLSAGITKNAVQTSSISGTASVATGQLGSRGGSRVVVLSYAWSQLLPVNRPQQASSGGGLTARVVLHRNGIEVATLDASGTWERTNAFSDAEPGTYSEIIGGSITYTDNSGGDKVNYAAYLVGRNLGPGAQNGSTREAQITQGLGIIQTEQ